MADTKIGPGDSVDIPMKNLDGDTVVHVIDGENGLEKDHGAFAMEVDPDDVDDGRGFFGRYPYPGQEDMNFFSAFFINLKNMMFLGGKDKFLSTWDWYFGITERKTSVLTEINGGITTFFALAYILVVNPLIVQSSGMPFNGIFLGTASASGTFTFLMGLVANLPLALAPGMGLNAYFVSVTNPNIPGNLTWQQGLTAVFLSGCIYTFLTITGVRRLIYDAFPAALKVAIPSGIGMFIAFLGLKLGYIVTCQYTPYTGAPPLTSFTHLDSTLWTLAFGNVRWRTTLDSVIALCFLGWFLLLNLPVAVLLSIFVGWAIGIPLGVTNLDPLSQGGWIASTEDSTAAQFDFSACGTGLFWEATMTLLFVDFFDSLGTLVGTLTRAGLISARRPKQAQRVLQRAFVVDGVGTTIGALMGVNSITVFIESSIGVQVGARTGLASMVTGTCFFAALLFLAPIVKTIPDSATTPALVVVGVYAIAELVNVDWSDIGVAMPAFFCVVLMPYTQSIANGIASGIFAFGWLNISRNLWGFLWTRFGEKAPSWLLFCFRAKTYEDCIPRFYQPVHWLMYPMMAVVICKFVLLGGH